jgi:hypothetical protein
LTPKTRVAGILIALLLFAAASKSSLAQDIDRARIVEALAAAYPDFLRLSNGKLIWSDGTEVELGTVRPRGQAASIIEAPSVAEQFLFEYPLAAAATRELPKFDPGRARNAAFFIRMYGDCRRGDLRGKTRRVVWLATTAPQPITVTTVNGIDRKLEAISAEIETLPAEKRAKAARLSGSYACRPIEGTGRLSMHAFGAAIDLNPAVGKYWRWSGLNETARTAHSVPPEIIEIFERHGFIWGGNWYHVDSIHFEYRPELIEYARLRARK